MILRAGGLLALLLMSGCASPATQLPSCWQADTFKAGERLAGSVTLLISGGDAALQSPSLVVMTPLGCERGSLLVENPSDFQLMRFSHPYREGDELFGTAVNATITGTVRIDPSEERYTHGRGRYRITLSSVHDPKPISRPAWWRR
ncbi:hypothetical protein FHR20_000346 [Sphingomonas leidyi]|uniref:Lipoprotein n=1 Tax=Sphingomonas leidyi TaxID=68569 RepID=A0A7X5UWY3_9SPHN|nr:hypothetical protein [Sphingomonas leidyi]NIJ63415.1 hypothetical protein [Sphingomonas leidyi]